MAQHAPKPGRFPPGFGLELVGGLAATVPFKRRLMLALVSAR